MIIGHYIKHLLGKGGAEVYLRRIALAQQKMGHTVYYFSKYLGSTDTSLISPIITESDAVLFDQAQQLGVELLHLHTDVAFLPPKNLTVIRTLQGHQPYCPSGSKYLKQHERPCDRAYSLHGCLWGHLVDRCGSARPHKLLNNFQRTFHEKRVLSTIPVLTNSEFLREHMIAAGYPKDLIRTLYLCAPQISTTSTPPQSDIPRFVFLGRLAPEKGLSWLIRSLQHVQTPIHLDIAGTGNQEPQIRELVQTLGLSDRITLHGWLDTESVYQLICKARALVFPSLWHEPAGMVAYEAMLNSRAAIASRVGGIPEGIIHETNGLLVEPNDSSGLAAQIDRLANNWALACRLGEAGHAIASQRFSLQTHMEALMQIYQQVMQPRRDDQVGLFPTQDALVKL
ncbi:glycosyltransferase family 4 protein [Myxacorys almedinensis]|uniref:Glycosyltransferase n=1 Tax=Myxacorys almedinensis A TaxID=2690445 RepID=A0A8J8CGY9_9CYAN|nr:glycosyltransferase family 4 protein [Myxacorys almedinensis]NDJ16218.1 glycosyltransferase [Myxacorys almedinensis A]